MRFYKIRKKGTTLFSSGGANPRWMNTGKIWASLEYVKSHLGQVNKFDFYKDAEIVEYAVTDVFTIAVIAVMQQVHNDKVKKQTEARGRREDAQQEFLVRLKNAAA